MLCQTLRPQAPTLRSTKPIYKMSSRNTSITTPNFVLQSVCGRASATWAMCLGLWAPVGPCGGIAKCVGTIEQCLARRGPARAEPSVKWGGPSKDNMRRTIPALSLCAKARVQEYTWPGSNWRPSACEADVIATRPQVPVQSGAGGLAAPAIELALRALAPQGGQAIPPNLLAQRGACVGAIAPFPVSRSCASFGHLRKSQ